MKYKITKEEEGNYVSLYTSERFNIQEAEYVFTNGGWEADGWIELNSMEDALVHYGVREITEKEKEFYRLYAEVYAELLEENARILDKRRELITK